MSDAVAECFERNFDIDIGPRGIATGGTTYGSALAIAVAKAVLEQIFTEDSYQRLDLLGDQLSGGLDAIFKRRGLPWTPFRCGPRSGFCLEPSLPHTGDDGARSLGL
jgi:glutamate-1-semialdehyde 2,1-aminomutase